MNINVYYIFIYSTHLIVWTNNKSDFSSINQDLASYICILNLSSSFIACDWLPLIAGYRRWKNIVVAVKVIVGREAIEGIGGQLKMKNSDYLLNSMVPRIGISLQKILMEGQVTYKSWTPPSKSWRVSVFCLSWWVFSN